MITVKHPTKHSYQKALEEIAHSSVPAESSELPVFVELLRHIAKSALPSDDSHFVTVEIDLSLEEWGMVAMMAHKRDCTINEMITVMVEKFIEENSSSDPE